jgi:5-methylthioadenosine/S-adenosylhomocysteine deaminase
MADAQPQRLLIRGGTILSMDPAVGDFDRGDILIEGETIASVGTHTDVSGPVEEIDATNCIVIPGMVDTHRHMWEAVLRGSAPQHTLMDYFTLTLGGVGPSITPEDAYVGDLLSSLSALGSGITTIQDISNIQETPEHSDAVIEGLRESGIRAVFSYALPLPRMYVHGVALPEDVRRVRSDTLSDSGARVTMALDTEQGDEETERHNAKLVSDLDLPVTRHISGEWPLTPLQEWGVLRPGTTFIHGNGLGAEQLKIVGDSGGSLSVAPAIELMMGFGLPVLPLAAELELLITFSVDIEVTCPSDMFTQMRAAYQSARYTEQAESGKHIAVRDILRYATINGAKSLGFGDRTGSITPGKQADLVILRADRPDVFPVYDPYSTVVLQMDRSHVDTVMVAGKVLKRHGQLVADTTKVLAQAAKVAKRLTGAGVLTEVP